MGDNLETITENAQFRSIHEITARLPKPIAEAIILGETKYNRIAEESGYGIAKIKTALRKAKTNKEELRVAILKHAYESGVRDIQTAMNLSKLSKSKLRKYEKLAEVHFAGTDYPEVISRHAKIDESIKENEGKTLKELGLLEGLSRQRVLQYLKGTEQYDSWKEQRKRCWVKND